MKLLAIKSHLRQGPGVGKKLGSKEKKAARVNLTFGRLERQKSWVFLGFGSTVSVGSLEKKKRDKQGSVFSFSLGGPHFSLVNIKGEGWVFLVFFFGKENSPKKKRQVRQIRFRYLTLHFGMNCNFVFIFFLHSYMCWISCLEYECYGFGLVNGTRLLFYDSPEKGSRGNFGSILDFLGIPS